MRVSTLSSRGGPVLAISIAHCLGLVACGGGSSSASPDSGSHTGAHEAGDTDFGSSSGGSSSGGATDGGGATSDDSGDASSTDATASGDGSLGDATLGDAAVPGNDGSATMSCEAPDGGAACDPGLVACGSSSCTTSSAYCCVGAGDAGSGACTAYNSASCPSGNLTVACDETSDCVGGVCCEEVIALGVAGPTQCMSACPSGWFQVCKSNTECSGGDDASDLNRCVRQTCTQPPGLLTPGSSVVVEACAVPPPPGVTISFGGAGSNGALQGCVAQ